MFDSNDFVCRHMQLTKADIVRLIRQKQLSSFTEIQDETDVGTVCGTCVADIEDILEAELERRRSNGSSQ
jgi:NAD(P)H-nitrite reductase large subunit